MHKSTLYIIATPIGNLEDITQRAIRILNEVDFILCEDTRVAKKLMSHYKIGTNLISYHQHSKISKIDNILNILKSGKDLALISDAGTPTISDPGGELVSRILEELDDSVKISPIPGPSAVISALSIAGIPASKYLFLGFPPHKKGRQKFLKEIEGSNYPVVVYESKYRIIKLLKELLKMDREVIVFRELTKMHETVYRGKIEDMIKRIENTEEGKGEFVVIIKKQ